VSISNYYEDKILDHMIRGVAFTPPTTIYASLHSGDPGEDGTANTVAVARVAVSFSASSGGQIALTSAVDFTSMPTVASVSYVALWDAAGTGSPPSGGNCLWSGALTTPRATTSGDTLRVSTLTVTLD